MASISQMSREIQIQQWNFNSRYHENTSIIIHPDFFNAFVGEFTGFVVPTYPISNIQLLGMNVTLSKDIKPNEFIIGEKFSVGEIK